uniref:Uncharacterized protein n=1 Tax=Oryza punctata TaxID=4537 RepID=A0A0E0LIR4_ORYPU
MYRFHQWYIEQLANGREMFGARVKVEKIICGSISRMSSIMKIQLCRKQGVFRVGFMDPCKIIEKTADDFAKETEDNMAWARFRTTVRWVFKEEPDVRMDFSVLWMTENLSHMDFIKVVQEQLMRFIMDEIINPIGEFHNDRRPIIPPHPRS